MNPLEIITSLDGTHLIDSRVIAWECGIQHRSVYKLILQFRNELESELGILRFEIALFGSRGQPVKYALLNEVQATALITLFRNTLPVVRFKIRLAKAFETAKQAIKDAGLTARWNSGMFTPKYPLDSLLNLMGERTWRTSELQSETTKATGMGSATFYRKLRRARASGKVIQINRHIRRAA